MRGCTWHGVAGPRVLLLEKQDLDSRLKGIAKPGSASNPPAPAAQSSRSGGQWHGQLPRSGENCPCLVASIKDKTGRGRIAFHLLHLPLLDFLITTLCGFWEKETPGRRRLTLLFPVRACLRACVRALGHSCNHPNLNAQRSEGPPKAPSRITSHLQRTRACRALTQPGWTNH